MAFDPYSAGIAGAGALAGAFQEQPQLPPEVQRALQMLMNLSRSDLKFSRGIPGSAPGELAGLAQMKGLLGEDYANQRGQLLGAAGGPMQGGQGNFQDMLQNLTNGQQGGYSNLLAQMMQQFMQNRTQARERAYGGFAQAGQLGSAPRTNTNMDLSGMLGGLAQSYAMGKALGPQGTTPGSAGISPAAGRLPTNALSQPSAGGPTWLSGQGMSPSSVGVSGVNYSNPSAFQAYAPKGYFNP